MGFTYFFYGAYEESVEGSSYNLAVAYWFVLLSCLVLSLMAIVRLVHFFPLEISRIDLSGCASSFFLLAIPRL
jgi:hypothetical protein